MHDTIKKLTSKTLPTKYDSLYLSYRTHQKILEVVDLLELDIDKLLDKGTLILLSPHIVVFIANWRVLYRACVSQQLLELGVVNVLILPWRIDGLLESCTETHDERD